MAKIEYTHDGMVIDGDLLTWRDIELERIAVQNKNKVIVKCEFWYSRQNFTIFEAVNKLAWQKILEDLPDLTLHFFDFYGKYSEVSINISDFEMIEDEAAIKEILSGSTSELDLASALEVALDDEDYEVDLF